MPAPLSHARTMAPVPQNPHNTSTPVIALLDFLERTVKPTLMIVRDMTARASKSVWMGSMITRVNAL